MSGIMPKKLLTVVVVNSNSKLLIVSLCTLGLEDCFLLDVFLNDLNFYMEHMLKVILQPP